MKVSELITLLQQQDQNADVHFAYDYGDRWHTTVAPAVQQVEAQHVEYSDYHSMHKIAVMVEDADFERPTAVVLS